MNELPEKTVEAAARAYAGARWWDTIGSDERASMARDAYLCDARNAFAGAMAPELGPDRLVVAGPHEQEIIAKVIRRAREAGAFELAAALFVEFGPPSEYEGIEADYR